LISVALGSGCAHMVKIDSTPGAEIFVNGQHVGQAPVQYQETVGASENVQVTAKLHGKEKTVQVQKDQTDWGMVGIGSGAGFGACWGAGTVASLASLVFLPCIVAVPVAWALLPAGAAAGWYFGHKMPDTVRVDLDDERRADAFEPAEEPEPTVSAADLPETKTAAVKKKAKPAPPPSSTQQF
jgi:hypothetical protein